VQPRSVSEVQYYVQQSGQSNAASSTIPVSQVQVAANPQHQQGTPEAATLPVMINSPAGDVQQANVGKEQTFID
jgi:hypothetical protein